MKVFILLLFAATTSANEIDLYWAHRQQAIGYKVYYSLDEWISIDVGLETFYTLEGLLLDEAYRVKIFYYDRDCKETMIGSVYEFIAGEKYESQGFGYGDQEGDQKWDHSPFNARPFFWLHAPEPESDHRPPVREDDGDGRDISPRKPRMDSAVDI